MAQGIYIASAEPKTYKGIVVLGMMELLWNQTQRVGFFKPVLRDEDVTDPTMHLIQSRYPLGLPREALYGCTLDVARDMIAMNRYDELLKYIMEKYKELEEHFDVIVCDGSDFTGVAAPLIFDFNADVANNLGCLVMPVVRGRGRSLDAIVQAVAAMLEGFEKRGCDILALVVNRIAPELLPAAAQSLRAAVPGNMPFYLFPDNEILWNPTVGEIAEALGACYLTGEEDSSSREVADYKVAAMGLANFLDYVREGSLIITPGDRSDIIVGALLADASTTYPRISGLVLTGNLKPAPQITRLIDGFSRAAVPILCASTDTFTTAMKVAATEGKLTPENERKIALALGIAESAVNAKEVTERLRVTRSTRVTPLMFEYGLIQRAKARLQHIVMPEGNEPRILKACELLRLRKVVDITLLGNAGEIYQKITELGLRLDDVMIIDPARSELREAFAEQYYSLRRHKGITREQAYDTMGDISYFGTMMVLDEDVEADGMVSGAVHTTQHTIRPALEVIRTKPGCSIVSSVFLMCLADRVLVFGDCAVNTNPDAQQLADIAISSAETTAMFGIEPRVAMLSYSTGESGKGKDVDKVREATAIARKLRPDLMIEGPLQYDAAVDDTVAKIKMPNSQVAGHATVFIFPDLNTGNNTYKAVQRSANAVAIGPILQGLNMPVNDLSRGCTVTDIVNTVAITAIQAQAAAR
jgi:phosphate acetyltransferase